MFGLIFENTLELYVVALAVLFFFIFALIVIAGKLASGENCYARMNKLHMILFFPYLVSTICLKVFIYRGESFPLIALIIGCFIYFSLHYVYFFSLVGLAKKSVSINILIKISKLCDAKGKVEKSVILENLNGKDNVLGFIREDRLKQMIILGWATESNSVFKITPKGKLFNKLGNLVLSIWNLERA